MEKTDEKYLQYQSAFLSVFVKFVAIVLRFSELTKSSSGSSSDFGQFSPFSSNRVGPSHHSPCNKVLQNTLCNVTSPNINSGRRLCWTRHPRVHLAAAAQPLFDPQGIEHRRPEDESGELL
ncbi:hypothetical protein TNCV_3476621 [Trichonephila clavipes]|nr:hypothetical protein TNCV_3476621 [Trichonephila clavipes]